MKTFEIKKSLFGGRAFKKVEDIRASNERQAAARFSQQTIKPRNGHYGVFLYGDLRSKFEVK